VGGFSRRWEVIKNYEVMQASIRYDPRRRDQNANRPMTLEEVYPVPDKLEAFMSRVFWANGFGHQLRTVFFEGQVFVGYFSILNTPGRGEFTERHRDIIRCLIPSLRDGLGAIKALGETPLDLDRTVRVLEGLDAPALLVGEQGGWCYSNGSARRRFAARPEWLGLIGGELDSPALEALADVTSLELDGKLWRLVLPREAALLDSAADPKAMGLDALSPRLKEVAEALVEGLSDKEIALRLDISLASARTYTHRVLQKLGLQSRRELIRTYSLETPAR
jgi:DNA-binding CsgD family transcriptional regulator